MKNAILTIILAAALIFVVAPVDAAENILDKSDFRIAGFTFGVDQIGDIITVLGEPERKVDRLGEPPWTDYWFAGLRDYNLRISSDGKYKVHLVQLISPRYATARGIRVGDDMAALVAAYGQGSASHSAGQPLRISYQLADGRPIQIIFEFADSGFDKVIEKITYRLRWELTPGL